MVLSVRTIVLQGTVNGTEDENKEVSPLDVINGSVAICLAIILAIYCVGKVYGEAQTVDDG